MRRAWTGLQSDERLAVLGEPDGVVAAGGVIGDVGNDCEASKIEEVAVLGGVEAGVVEGLILECADGFAVGRAGGEKQGGARRGVLGEDGEHGALVIGGEMKEAVPGDDAGEALVAGKGAHVGDKPSVGREAGAATTSAPIHNTAVTIPQTSKLLCNMRRLLSPVR